MRKKGGRGKKGEGKWRERLKKGGGERRYKKRGKSEGEG